MLERHTVAPTGGDETDDRTAEVRVITHALARDALARLRAVETEVGEFRRGLVELGRVCGGVLAHDFVGTTPVEVETPLATTTAERIAGDVVLVNVLRAATPFVEGMLAGFPEATQGMVSASRQEAAGMTDDAQFPVETEYVKLPAVTDRTVIIADPMLATGSTIQAVLDTIHDHGRPARTAVVAAVAAPEGLVTVAEREGAPRLYAAAVDERLDDLGYIVPGLGDAGDRAFGTEE